MPHLPQGVKAAGAHLPQRPAQPCRQALAEEAHSSSRLTELQRINFIGHLGSVSLLALARDLGWCEDWSCCLVQSGGDLVDVVETNHGEDEATGKTERHCQPGVSQGGHQHQGKNPSSGLGRWGVGKKVGGRLDLPPRRTQGQRSGCCSPDPAVRHLPGGDTDSMDEARCKKSQQEAEENWGGKRECVGGQHERAGIPR